MTHASPALPAARDDRWLALAVLCAGTLMIVLDATIVNVALPAIQRDLGFGPSSLAWVVNAYLIAFGGVLTEALNWHWIFFVNVPIGIVTGILALRLIEDDEGLGLGEGADVLGALLVTGALMLGVLTIIRTSDVGWTSIETLATGVTAMVALVAFVVREARTANPLLPLRIFRSRAVTGANAVMLLLVAGFFGTFFIGSLYLERVLRFDALAIGLGFLPVSLSIGLMSFAFAEPLITRFGHRVVLRGSLGMVLVALLWLARLPASATYFVDVAPSLALIGIGAGLGFPAIVGLAMSGATSSDAGLASGLVNTTRMVGGSLGLAVMASIASTRGAALAAVGADGAAALTGGSQLALAFAAALIVAAIGVAWTVLRADGVAQPDRESEAIADIEAMPDAA